MKIKTCATSANLGPGFDTLGIALNLYNEFEVKRSDELIFHDCDPRYANQDNLFYVAYEAVCKKLEIDEKCEVKFTTNIPLARGLGSSASLIVAGAVSCNHLHQDKLSKEDIFKICTCIEGHPDNIAPCLYGGLVTSIDSQAIQLPVSHSLHFTLIIPDYELSTKKAREVLPKMVKIEDATKNITNTLALCKALENNDQKLLKSACKDYLHQPYRKNLIKDYDLLEEISYQQGALAFMISGAGPSCLLISKQEDFSKKIIDKLPVNYKVNDLSLDYHGYYLIED